MQLSEHCQGCQEDAGCQGDGSGDTCVSQINESRGTVLPDSLHAMSRAEPSLVTHFFDPDLQFPKLGKACVHDLLAVVVEYHGDLVVPGCFLYSGYGAFAVAYMNHAVAGLIFRCCRCRYTLLRSAGRSG